MYFMHAAYLRILKVPITCTSWHKQNHIKIILNLFTKICTKISIQYGRTSTNGHLL